MTERQLGHVLFRVVGLWMVAEAVAQSGTVYSDWIRLPTPPTGWERAVIAPMAIYLVTGLVVWGWADRLAALIFSDSLMASAPPLVDVPAVYRAVVSALGLFLLVTALPYAVSWLAGWFQATGDAGTLDASDHEILYGIAARERLVALVTRFCQEVCKRDQAAAFDLSSRFDFLRPST